MKSLYQHRAQNVIKTWFLMGAFLVLLMIIGWFFAQYFGNPNILYGFFIFSMIMNLVSYWYSDKIALSISGAKEVSEASHPEYFAIMSNLTQKAQLPMPRLYVIPDQAPNAFATGRNKNHSAVAVTQGLLDRLSRQELEGVLAHELAHIGNKDILISTVAVVLAGIVTLLSDMVARSFMFGGRNNENGGNGIVMIIGLVLSILAPIGAMLIQLAISRKREYLADATAAMITKNPDGLADALTKIASHNAPLLRANNATAHMYIANPWSPAARALRGMSALFMTHPPIEQRIRILRDMDLHS